MRSSFLLAIGKRQFVEIGKQGPWRGFGDSAVLQESEPRDIAPVLAGAQPLDELEQRHLALEAGDAVELGEIRQHLVVTEARIVSADDEMAVDADGSKMLGQALELGQKKLKDQGEPDDQRRRRQQALADPLRSVAHIDHLDRAAVRLEHSREVYHAEIALILIADQDGVRPDDQDWYWSTAGLRGLGVSTVQRFAGVWAALTILAALSAASAVRDKSSPRIETQRPKLGFRRGVLLQHIVHEDGIGMNARQMPAAPSSEAIPRRLRRSCLRLTAP